MEQGQTQFEWLGKIEDVPDWARQAGFTIVGPAGLCLTNGKQIVYLGEYLRQKQ